MTDMPTVIVVNERTANAIRAQYDGELPSIFVIAPAIPDGAAIDLALLMNDPLPKACRNCGRSIVPAGGSPTGWTHDPGSPIKGWQGIRCPSRLCGAAPIVVE
ncbi:MAG TPA: hypothetical protein VGS19_23880 [Streptosporangiaceae bacterium]|nr:hypothetical protein [Streptosporangiaceae bacterium]